MTIGTVFSKNMDASGQINSTTLTASSASLNVFFSSNSVIDNIDVTENITTSNADIQTLDVSQSMKAKILNIHNDLNIGQGAQAVAITSASTAKMLSASNPKYNDKVLL
jgi:hypothetical protein